MSYATGASAGALVAGLFASGLSPRCMGETVVKFRRSDFWDPLGMGGFLRGTKFEVNLVLSYVTAGSFVLSAIVQSNPFPRFSGRFDLTESAATLVFALHFAFLSGRVDVLCIDEWCFLFPGQGRG